MLTDPDLAHSTGSGPARVQCKNLLSAYSSPEWPLAHIVHRLTNSINARWFKRHKQECQSIKKHLKRPLCARQRASFKVTPQGILCRKRTGKQNKMPKLALKKRMQSGPTLSETMYWLPVPSAGAHSAFIRKQLLLRLSRWSAFSTEDCRAAYRPGQTETVTTTPEQTQLHGFYHGF